MVRKSSIILGIMAALIFYYFAYEIIYVFPKVTSAAGTTLNIILVSAEMLTAVFSIYLYHSVFCSMEWRHINYRGLKKFPFATIQIPVFNEPVRTVKDTVKACKAQDYPKERYEIIVADDSTDTKKMKMLEKLCRKEGVKFFHRDHRRGYKAGALNDVLGHSKGEVLVLLDADDMPEKTFLSHSIEVLTSSDKIAFVQSRNAERNDGKNLVTSIGRMIRDLFFGSIMKSKDMRKLSIFCGSSGVIKRSVVEEMGGWPEQTVTEDIDISTKIFAKGYVSKFINPVECKGLLPVSFSSLTGQTYRWAHGTTKTLMLRWRNIMKIPGFWRKSEHFLSCATYVLGPSILIIDLVMAAHLLLKIPIFHMYEPVGVWVFGVGLTLSSFFALLYVQFLDEKINMKRIFAYIFAMYGLSVNFTLATISALTGRKFAFFRTPKTAQKKDYSKIAKRYWIESLVAAVSIYAGVTNLMEPAYSMQAAWVIFFGIGFLTSPLLALKYG
ncbi:MAG: glycosyltransferase [Candidatus Aenigmarchaeota archaeon]|nr:glycosyltransferase [Candidatus Aenigmarchaeota archaeon]